MKRIIDLIGSDGFFSWLLIGVVLLITGNLIRFLVNILNK